MQKTSQKFWDDLKWGEKHHTEFLDRYRDKWVAIKNKEVVAYGNNLEKVEKKAKQRTGEDVPVIFVEGGEHIYGQN